MTPHLPFMMTILLLLLVARVGGELMERFGQPSIVGEILAGIILGPSVLGWIHLSPELKGISEIGIFLLILLAGMEMKPEEFKIAFRGRNAWIPVLSFLIPLGAGIAVGVLFNLDAMRRLFLGLCIAITALPVSVRILMDLGRIRTDVGQRILSTAVANDVVALLLLGVILDFKSGASTWATLVPSLLWSMAKVLLFMVFVVGAYRLVRLSTQQSLHSRIFIERLIDKLRGKDVMFALTILFVMVFASLAEAVGLHFIVGAFFGAMLLSREMLGPDAFDSVRKTTSAVAVGFLAPLFFASIGLEFEGSSLQRWRLILVVLVVAFGSKILAGYWGGRLAGFAKSESLTLGVGLNARGIMEIIIAQIALTNGFIGPTIFSILVLVGLATTVMTPFLLKKAFARSDRDPAALNAVSRFDAGVI